MVRRFLSILGLVLALKATYHALVLLFGGNVLIGVILLLVSAATVCLSVYSIYKAFAPDEPVDYEFMDCPICGGLLSDHREGCPAHKYKG